MSLTVTTLLLPNSCGAPKPFLPQSLQVLVCFVPWPVAAYFAGWSLPPPVNPLACAQLLLRLLFVLQPDLSILLLPRGCCAAADQYHPMLLKQPRHELLAKKREKEKVQKWSPPTFQSPIPGSDRDTTSFTQRHQGWPGTTLSRGCITALMGFT